MKRKVVRITCIEMSDGSWHASFVVDGKFVDDGSGTGPGMAIRNLLSYRMSLDGIYEFIEEPGPAT